jgi:hypothetical protein
MFLCDKDIDALPFHALSFCCIPIQKKPRDILKEYTISLPHIKLTVAELAGWGFHHPLPSHLSALQSDILEELFCAADRALTAKYGVGIMKSFTISDIQIDYSPAIWDWDLPIQHLVPTWFHVSPPGKLSRPDLSFISEELKEGLKSEFEIHL